MSAATVNQPVALWISQQQSPQELNGSGRGLKCASFFFGGGEEQVKLELKCVKCK